MILAFSLIQLFLTALIITFHLKKPYESLRTARYILDVVFIIFIGISVRIIPAYLGREPAFTYLKITDIIACMFICSPEFIKYLQNKNAPEGKRGLKRVWITIAVFAVLFIIISYYGLRII